MSETIEILKNSKRSVNSVDVERSLNVDIKTTTGPLANNDIKSTIDVNEQYMLERNSCDDYRLIITIKPYCTNVLFNPCTEVVMAEGSDNTDAVLFDDKVDTATLNRIKAKIKGKNTDIEIYDMIRNTEYSKEAIGFEYHPGLDIFNNHIIRNKTYRVVNDYAKTTEGTRLNFNTISDYMRDLNGNVLKRCCRVDITDNIFKDKHLYDKDDILLFYTGEAVSENLREQNGWFGFYNTSVIPAKSRGGVDMDISRVINNKGNCEFIDMYPDRTLFSFIPKYNEYRNRLEYNWDYALTYAFDSTMTYKYKYQDEPGHDVCEEKDFDIVKSGEINALMAITVEYRSLPNGNGAIFFRSATKHNLNPNDKVYIYFNENETENGETGNWHKSCHTYLVAGVGDINHKNKEYYFYVTDLGLLEEIFCTPFLCDVNPQQVNDEYTEWDYVKDYFYTEYNTNLIDEFNSQNTYVPGQLTRNTIDEKVYITQNEHTGTWNGNDFIEFTDTYFVTYPETGLTNIPSEMDRYIKVGDTKYILCNHDRGIVYDGSVDCNLFIQAIINNAFTNNDNYTTNSEVNEGMNGLWSDYISIRFVRTNGNYDCSYYIRKFKKIPGSDGITMDKETYQLAFSETIYGDKIAQSVFTDNINVSGLKDNLGRDLSEVFLTIVKTNRGYEKWYGLDDGDDGNVYNDPDIEYSHCFGPVTCGFELFNELDDTKNIRDTRSALIDVSMINVNSTPSTIPNCEVDDGFTTTDITIDDDWFYGDVVEFCPWTCEETTISDVCFRFNTAQREMIEVDDDVTTFKFDEIESDDYDAEGFKVDTFTVKGGLYRPEGYYHKAHYRIPLRDLSSVIQGSHSYISVYDARPVQADDMYIMVRTSLKHNLLPESKVLLRDTVSGTGTEWWLDVVYVVDDHTFVMNKISRTDDNYQDWIAICKHLNDNTYTLRAKNTDIPEKASRLGINTYLWRETVKTTDFNNTESEVNNYVFANNALYVDTCFNFYLKRQDPYKVNGLYFDGSSCTIEGTSNWDLNNVDKWFIGDVESKADTRESIYEYNDEKYESQC